tara:strand:+ start:3113 stop:3292 length:180 start_codon:yes stop_codon:yes gene_type:complete
MSEAIIDGVNRIANQIYKQRGYAITISKADTATILEAFILLSNKIKEENSGEKENKGKV